MAETIKLKEYYGKDLAILLAEKITTIDSNFDTKTFVNNIATAVPPLELKSRVTLIAEELKARLMPPHDYQGALKVLLGILGPENPKETGMFKEGYWLMPVARFVELFGLDHYETSVQAIYEITKRHTGEYAIRPYIEQRPQQSLEIMRRWAQDSNVHVRRLASEGLRPRLPWAKQLKIFIEDPSPVLELLDLLKTDSSMFVKKSVANNLNDILKDNYEAAMAVLQQWSELENVHINWIVKHALRNRLKQKDPEALAIVERFRK